jgi:hypothetical protein
MGWDYPWQERMGALAGLLSRQGIPLQVIYNGSGRDGTGREWIEHAMIHAREFEKLARPDAVAIQCWTKYPDHLLPESDPEALTNLINRYVEWKATSR